MAEQLVERTVITDIYSWMVPGDRGGDPYIHNTAHRGDTISVTAAEAKRGEELGGLGTPQDLAVADVDRAGLAAVGNVADEQLRGYKAEELLAYLQQNPADAARVTALEQERGSKARKTVLEMADRVAEEYAKATDAAAEARAAQAEEAALAAGGGAPTVPGAGPTRF